MCRHNQITFTHQLLNIAVLIYNFKIVTCDIQRNHHYHTLPEFFKILALLLHYFIT